MSAMNSAHEDFVQEIASRPDDDTPRLVYADWLEDQGDLQGEFIRVQCELAQPSNEPDRTAELRHRQRELLAAHRAEWVRAVSGSIRWCEFRRGLLEEAIIEGSSFVPESGQALRRAPILELGTCLSSNEQIAAFAAMPELRQLRKLRLGCSRLGDNGIRQLVQSPHFPSVKVLWLTRCNLGPAGAETLANCTALAGLERLILNGNPLGDQGARILATSPTFANLQQLSLDDCEMSVDGELALSQSSTLTNTKGLPTYNLRQQASRAEREEARRLETTDIRRPHERPRQTPSRMSVEEILRQARAYRPPTRE